VQNKSYQECTKCKLTRHVDQFRSRANICRACENEFKRGRRREDPLRAHLQDAKKRSKKKGFDFDLTLEHLNVLLEKQSNRCYWFSIPLVIDGTKDPAHMSLDRLDNFKGYTKDNVVIASRAANLARNNTDVQTFTKFLDSVWRSNETKNCS